MQTQLAYPQAQQEPDFAAQQTANAVLQLVVPILALHLCLLWNQIIVIRNLGLQLRQRQS
jgi:hypothetical protein